MYARIERFNLSQGFIELAEELADRIAPIMRRQPGLRTMTLLADDSSGEYIFLTHWDTLEQINVYERSADEWRVRDIMSPHLTAVPIIEVYQVHALAAVPEPAAVGVVSGTATTPAGGGTAARAAAPSAAVQRALSAGAVIFEPSGGQCPAGFPIKGNASGSMDFVYHVPGSPHYDRTVPEVCFASEADAIGAGFREARS